MKLEILRPVMIARRQYNRGDIVDLPRLRAKALIRSQSAREITVTEAQTAPRAVFIDKGYLRTPSEVGIEQDVVFLTGHLGWLGSAIIKELSQYWEVIGYDLKDGNDILDYDRLKAAMKGTTIVIHGAGIPHPNPRYKFDDYWQTNVLGTLNVLRAAVENKCSRFIYLCSGAVYGWDTEGIMIPLYFPIDEEHPPLTSTMRFDGKLNAYAQSKLIAEELVAWYGTNYCFRREPLSGCYQAVSLRIAPAVPTTELLSRVNRLDREKTFWANADPPTVAYAVRLILESGMQLPFDIFNVAEKTVPEGVNLYEYLKAKYPAVPLKAEWQPPESLYSTKKLQRVFGF